MSILRKTHDAPYCVSIVADAFVRAYTHDYEAVKHSNRTAGMNKAKLQPMQYARWVLDKS